MKFHLCDINKRFGPFEKSPWCDCWVGTDGSVLLLEVLPSGRDRCSGPLAGRDLGHPYPHPPPQRRGGRRRAGAYQHLHQPSWGFQQWLLQREEPSLVWPWWGLALILVAHPEFLPRAPELLRQSLSFSRRCFPLTEGMDSLY